MLAESFVPAPRRIAERVPEGFPFEFLNFVYYFTVTHFFFTENVDSMQLMLFHCDAKTKGFSMKVMTGQKTKGFAMKHLLVFFAPRSNYFVV